VLGRHILMIFYDYILLRMVASTYKILIIGLLGVECSLGPDIQA
jgi:hypothetical protein